ncbi:unnamed protein product [Penicillium nalgiovense]|nr:unnamed protein product [Penicillium nalgiovense]
MPRPRIDIEPYKGEILNLISENITHIAICDSMLEKYGITISLRSLRRSLAAWSPSTNQLLPLYNTQDILRILSSEGIPSSKRTLYRIRADLGITLRLSPEQRQQQFDDIEAILIAKHVISEIEDYGYRTLYRHLRAIGLYYTDRLPGARRQRINYVSLGPNDIWHIDGHMKLEPFGFEIYTAIDGYSRFIV